MPAAGLAVKPWGMSGPGRLTSTLDKLSGGEACFRSLRPAVAQQLPKYMPCQSLRLLAYADQDFVMWGFK